MRRALALLPLIFAAAACGDAEDPRPARWSYIHAAIILPNCATATCHSELSQVGDKNLEDRQSACETAHGTFGFDSVLRGIDPERPRMPPDQPLPERDIELIRAWFNGGTGTCD